MPSPPLGLGHCPSGSGEMLGSAQQTLPCMPSSAPSTLERPETAAEKVKTQDACTELAGMMLV